MEGFGVVLDDGLNKVRFPSPLRVGSRIRVHVEVAAVTALDTPGGPGAEACSIGSAYEVEGRPKPCCVADLVFRYYP